MLPSKSGGRKRSTRATFRQAQWDNEHPAFRRIDSDLPTDHVVRWIVEFVSHLDLEPLRCSYANCGSQANHPDFLVPFILYMYSRGILSPARWVAIARYDDQAKWLLRGLRPGRSQLYDFRNRLGPFLAAWHKQLIDWALAGNITTATSGSLDGTFVASLASRHRLFGFRALHRRLMLLHLAVWLDDVAVNPAAPLPDEVCNWVVTNLLLWLWFLTLGVNETCSCRRPAWVPLTVVGRKRVLKRYEQAWQRLATRLEPYFQKKSPLSKKEKKAVAKMKVSLTDADAVLGWDKVSTFRPLFNVALVQAIDSPLTLAWDVFSRNNDQGLLRPMMEKAKEQTGRYLQAVLVDGGFINIGDLLFCEKEGITIYAPPRTDQQTNPEKKNKPSKKEKIAKAAFRYDSVRNVYYCPQEKQLEQIGRHYEKRQGGARLTVLVYRAKAEDCQACPRQKECNSSLKKGRVVKRYQGEEALQRLAARMKDPANQEIYKQRGQTVELGYADIKEHRGLRAFRGFGMEQARTQAGLVILASNGLKIIRALLRRKPPTGLNQLNPDSGLPPV